MAGGQRAREPRLRSQSPKPLPCHTPMSEIKLKFYLQFPGKSYRTGAIIIALRLLLGGTLPGRKSCPRLESLSPDLFMSAPCLCPDLKTVTISCEAQLSCVFQGPPQPLLPGHSTYLPSNFPLPASVPSLCSPQQLSRQEPSIHTSSDFAHSTS